ncbi:hypothetical protein ABT392_14540 [Paucibacter sp. JuS9]|uniref:hypothetical protein n=1 Tax=Paucibacter sp. JuS9 TaxID=3228748 RepID=UPI003756A987
MSATLLINDVFEALGIRYRLLHVDDARKTAYVIQLDAPHPLPEPWPLDDLTSCADLPDVLRLVPDPCAQDRPVSPRPDDVATRDRRYRRLKDLVHFQDGKPHPDLWEPEKRRQLLRAHSLKVHVTEKWLLQDLRRWWLRGQTIDGLLGEYWKCGRIDGSTAGALVCEEKSRNGLVSVVFAPAKHRARGRTPKDGQHGKLALSAELRAVILEVAKKHYLEDQSRSVHGTTITVLDELFSLRDEDGHPLRDENGAAVLKEPGQRPTFDQVRYLLRRALPLSKAFVSRNDAALYENNHAPSTGSVLDDCLGPGDVFEIDATILDMWVVARANRASIIGKPTFYLIIDRGSRLIVGFYLSLEPPSWTEARQAILSIAGDWEGLCKRLGVTYNPRDWPARGVMPNRFFGDRGDMIAYASDVLCDGVSVQVTNAPALQSKRKPLVESGFICVSTPLRDNALGYEPPKNAFKRRAKKFHKDACHTLDEVAADMLRIIIKHNRTQKLGYQQSPEEILADESVSPIAIWNREVANRIGSVARMPIDLLRRKLLPEGEATVHVDGVEYGGLLYKANDRSLGEWHVRASLRGSFKVKVSYNPCLVDNITVQDPFDDSKRHDLVLTTTSEAYAGYSFAEVKYVVDKRGTKDRAAARTNEAHAVALRQDMRTASSVTAAATKEAAKGMTPGMRRSGGDEVRELEAQERRRVVNDLQAPDLQYGPPGAASDAVRHAAAPAGTSSSVPPMPAAEPTTAARPTPPAPTYSDTDPSLMGDLDNMLDTL